MSRRVVVIGGDAGGMTAGSQALRRDPSLEIVALEMGRYTSYSACGIPYLVGGDVASFDDLVVRTPQQHREHGIDVRLRHEVMAIDLAARDVEVRDHEDGRTYNLGFDELVVATGAVPIRPDLPGLDGEHVHGVQTLDDAAHLLDDALTDSVQRVAVVGAGYIGVEMAEAFLKRGRAVTVVERGRQVMPTLDSDMARLVGDAMVAMGIDLRLGTEVTGFDPGAVHTNADEIAADVVILGIGVTPRSQLATDAGLETGVNGAIRVDRRQRASADGVWAAGDCCESFHLVSERPVHIALGTHANKQGRVAGINLGGGYATFPGVVGTAASQLCDLEVARTGLTEREAAAAGFVADAATIESTTRAGYFPGTGPLTVKLVTERNSGRLLGGQIVGREGAAKRIDVLATALTMGMTVEEMTALDLSYAPPFSSVWDPLLVAARKAAESA